MRIELTPLKDCFVVHEKVHSDARGYFIETYNSRDFKAATGLDIEFVQDNQSRSSLGVLRGLHYQIPPFAQAKLVRVIEGKVLDVAVDIRPNSRTYGEWFSIVLSAKNKKQLFIPRGFAHGFLVLSETAEFFYKCDNFYSKEHEGGLLYDDPNLNIDWKLDMEKVLLSEKDSILPTFGNHRSF